MAKTILAIEYTHNHDCTYKGNVFVYYPNSTMTVLRLETIVCVETGDELEKGEVRYMGSDD